MTPLLSPQNSQAIQALINDRLGLHLVPDDMLDKVVAVRMRATDCQAVSDYLALLSAPSSAEAEWRALAQPLTVGETYFFRVPDQFRALTEVALPDRLIARSHTRRLRLLSAGCASGEEAYTLAMMVETLVPGPPWRVAIEGVDLNSAMLAQARQASYTPWSLRATPEALRERHFQREGGTFRVRADIRRMVRFEERNLLDDDAGFWEPGSFDVIFFRNVSIYFSPEATRRVIARFAQALAPGGYLFLGPAESLRDVSNDFQSRHTHGTFYYQRLGEAAPERAATPPSAPGDRGWADTIRQATERITALAETAGTLEEGPRRRPARVRPLALVRAMFREERFAEALAHLEAMPEDAAEQREVLLIRAAVLTHLGRSAEAEAACSAALALDGACAEAHYMLALGCEAAGDHAKAARHSDAASRLDPNFAMPHLHRGLRANRAGEWAEARVSLQRARSLLAHEEADRVLLFGGGFGKEALEALCLAELHRCGGEQ